MANEPPTRTPSVRRFCRCRSLDRHAEKAASITPKERHRSRQLRAFVTAVSSPRPHATARLLWTAPGSVRSKNTQPGRSVPVQRRIYLFVVEPPDGTSFLFAAGFLQRVQPTLRERACTRDRAHTSPPPRTSVCVNKPEILDRKEAALVI